MTTVEQLSAAAARHGTDAYRDVDWDHPDHVVDPDDERWQLPAWDPLAATDWYRDQAPATRSRLGLERVVRFLKTGIEFEAFLQQGLLRFALALPDGSPVFRFVHHEIVEEAQHSMMFQELVNRAALDLPGHPEANPAHRSVVEAADTAPELFFLCVIGGEEPIDHLQRRAIREPRLHPLLRRVNRLHVADEARHLSFAHGRLCATVPALPERRRRRLRYQAPLVVERMARRMVEPPAGLLDRYDVPAEVRAEVADGPALRHLLTAATAKVAATARACGIVDRTEAVWAGLFDRRPR